MYHHLVDLRQVCSNYAPGAKHDSDQGITCFTLACIGKHEKIFLTHRRVDLYQVCLKYPPGANNGPASGITCFTKAYIGKM